MGNISYNFKKEKYLAMTDLEKLEYLNELWEISDNLLIGIVNYQNALKDEFSVQPRNFNGEKINHPYKSNEYIEEVFGYLNENPIIHKADVGDLIIFKYIKNNYEYRWSTSPISVEKESVILGVELGEKNIILPPTSYDKKIEYLRYLKSIDTLKRLY